MRPPAPAGRTRTNATGARLAAAWGALVGCAAGLAWLAPAAPRPPVPTTLHAVLWGPLQETALMLAAARVIGVALGRVPDAAMAWPSRALCAGVIGPAFWLAHRPVAAGGALLALGMSLLLAATASRVATEPSAWRPTAAALFGLHAVHNVCVLSWAGLL